MDIKFLLLGATLVLAGCGQQMVDPRVADNFGDGFSFDEVSTVTGIRVRLGGLGSVHIDEVDRTYLWTAEHMGIATTPDMGPLVIFKSQAEIIGDDGQQHSGLYRPATRTMWITDTLIFFSGLTFGDTTYPPGPAIDLSNNSPLVDQVICHESVHHLLFIATGDADHDHKHKLLFDDCFYVFNRPPRTDWQ